MSKIIQFKAKEGAPDVQTVPPVCTLQHGIIIPSKERTNTVTASVDTYLQVLQDIKTLLILIVILKIICLIRKH